MKKIEKYQILDHGVDHAQYFRGCGTTFTEFQDVATGVGDTAAEALEDALESLAQCDWDTSTITETLDDEESVCDVCEHDRDDRDPDECDGCELHYYVSVRVR